MPRVIKFGDLYLTATGTLSPAQKDALRVDRGDVLNDPRIVKLTPIRRADDLNGSIADPDLHSDNRTAL